MRKLTLVPNSIWLLEPQNGNGEQLAGKELPVMVENVPSGSSVLLAYQMVVKLNPSNSQPAIQLQAYVQETGKEMIQAPVLTVPVVRKIERGLHRTKVFFPLAGHEATTKSVDRNQQRDSSLRSE